MSDIYNALYAAVGETRRMRQAIKEYANQMAALLPGNLHHVDSDTLMKLKRELANYNTHTKRWKA